jgi:uncharacterized protein (TIGR00304 family)
MDQAFFNMLGVILVFAGFFIAFIAILLWIFRSVKGGGKVKGGGAVIIGPFPIVFGTDKESVRILLLLSIALIAILLVFMAFSYFAFK